MVVDCPTWPASYEDCGPCPPLDGLTPEQTARWERMAVDFLWNWTGRMFGLCDVTVRPCRDISTALRGRYGAPYRPGDSSYGSQFQPALVAGRWYNVSCGMCGGSCSCDTTPSLQLPGPIDSVIAVTIDGVILDPGKYRVDNTRLLVRTDGGAWPTMQDMNSAPTAAGTWQIQYVRGMPVPVQGQVAAGMLACELAKAACNDATCKLPQRIQTITRQGVTMAMLDPMTDVERGHTGLWLVDSWVASVTRTPQRARVHSPDVSSPSRRVQTWPST